MKGAKIVWVGKVVSNMWRRESDQTLVMLREVNIKPCLQPSMHVGQHTNTIAYAEIL